MRAWLELKLIDFVDKTIGNDFEWGKTDCCSLAVRAFDNIFDTKNAEGNLITSLKEGGEEKALELCSEDCAKKIMLLNGFQEINLSLATCGDILYLKKDGFERLHICLGDSCLTSSQEKGVYTVSTLPLIKLLNENEGLAFRNNGVN